MKRVMKKLEHLLSLGGIKKDIVLLVISGAAVVCSLLEFHPFPFDMACSQSFSADCPSFWKRSSGLSQRLI